MANPTVDYTLCDTAALLASALEDLKTSTALAFDCEGQSLGTRGGSLSLLSFRAIVASASSSNKTYIIDAVRLSTQDLRPIFDILESNEVLKVVFDGRMDYSCLYHDHGVQMRRVLDLQLADIKSRTTRGEGEAERLGRLGRLIPGGDLAVNHNRYMAIHKLGGLRQCAEEHKVTLPTFGGQGKSCFLALFNCCRG